jgi:GNAT superfamily N-acetyltransferase
MYRRFVIEPGLIGLDGPGFRDPNAVQRRFDTDSYLGEDNGRLIVDVAPGTQPGNEPAGLVSYRKRYYGTQAFCWEIGIALLPEWRGRGIGWRAQAMFCSYLFENTPVQRIEATEIISPRHHKAVTRPPAWAGVSSMAGASGAVRDYGHGRRHGDHAPGRRPGGCPAGAGDPGR